MKVVVEVLWASGRFIRQKDTQQKQRHLKRQFGLSELGLSIHLLQRCAFNPRMRQRDRRKE